MLEEVAQGAGRFARTVLTVGTIGLMALATTTSGAVGQQQTADASATLAAIKDPGQAALDICKKRGDATAECVSTVRNQLVIQISTEANTTEQRALAETKCSGELTALRTSDPSIVEKGRKILNGAKPSEFGLCKLLGHLKAG